MDEVELLKGGQLREDAGEDAAVHAFVEAQVEDPQPREGRHLRTHSVDSEHRAPGLADVSSNTT